MRKSLLQKTNNIQETVFQKDLSLRDHVCGVARSGKCHSDKSASRFILSRSRARPQAAVWGNAFRKGDSIVYNQLSSSTTTCMSIAPNCRCVSVRSFSSNIRSSFASRMKTCPPPSSGPNFRITCFMSGKQITMTTPLVVSDEIRHAHFRICSRSLVVSDCSIACFWTFSASAAACASASLFLAPMGS